MIIHQGDCLDVLRTLPDGSVDAVICDPPYGLADHKPDAIVTALTAWANGDRDHVPDGRGFMGRDWDAFVPPPAVWDECLRLLKPGGHLVAFAGSRTYDLMGLSIRMAGFEIRDGLQWLYGSGFPKSHSVSKATQPQVESRYGSARCDCVVTADGRPDRNGVRREGRGDAVAAGGSGQVPASEARTADVPLGPSCGRRGLRELRAADTAEAAGSAAVGPTVLLPDVRGRGSEAPRLGDPEVRAGLEEPASGDPAPGQGVPCMREDAGTERVGAACASPGAVPVRRDEPAGEPGRAVRPVPPRDRGSDGSGAGSDPGRSDPRRVVLEGDGGRRAPVARVCSWCGLPDRTWLASLEPFGSALKPAHEPIVLARRPLGGTVAATVLQHGTGALNIDACRVATDDHLGRPHGSNVLGVMNDDGWRPNPDLVSNGHPAGRWPSNVLLTHAPGCGPDEDPGPCVDGCPVAELDQQSGASTSKSGGKTTRALGVMNDDAWVARDLPRTGHDDSGGASRFFPSFRYQAKAPSSERPKVDGVAHPTVKPVALMRWLVRLLTPPGGVVLDPFAGSGTTIEAALLEGFTPIGIERDPQYLPLIQHRIDRAHTTIAARTAQPLGLFDLDDGAA